MGLYTPWNEKTGAVLDHGALCPEHFGDLLVREIREYVVAGEPAQMAVIGWRWDEKGHATRCSGCHNHAWTLVQVGPTARDTAWACHCGVELPVKPEGRVV